MNSFTIIPSNLKYQSAPSVDQELNINLDNQERLLVEYDRIANVSLAQVYDDERQASEKFRPTFKASYIYSNTITGTTSYIPFVNTLYYLQPEVSKVTGSWRGFPQYYEFDFYRDDINNAHINYKPINSYKYNWNFYVTFPFQNDYKKQFSTTIDNTSFNWKAEDGIPFIIRNGSENGNSIIQFECICPHGLTSGESVELSMNYNGFNIFEVYSLGNGLLGSDRYIFNVYNVGYTGNTFANSVKGTFKRIVNFDNPIETKSKYYVRRHKVLTYAKDAIINKAGFEKNPFNDEKKLEFSSITPDNQTRISQKNSSNAYNITFERDIDLTSLIDNQKRPISEIFLTVINKGYSGYFNKPFNGVGLKQGWEFNITSNINSWWDSNNSNSNTNISVSSYTQTSGVTSTFYYNQDLKIGDTLDGDFCEWNDYYQVERVISSYHQKIKYNPDTFQTTTPSDTNPPGFYYKSHASLPIRVFSNYIETGDKNTTDLVPSWAYYSNSDQQFRWREIYTYGFVDDERRGVDYPFLNGSHYPFRDFIFKLIPDNVGYNINDTLKGVDLPYQPIIDGCE